MDKELYPVFRVDICFEPYSIDDVLIGAKSREDLLENFDFKKYLQGTYTSEELLQYIAVLKEFENRIELVKDLYTDRPYEVLETFMYYE